MSKKHIVVVEDDPSIQQLIQYNLAASNYEVTVFESGEACLQKIETIQCSLFVLDIMLPGTDGLDLCKRLRVHPRQQSTPILLLTAKSEEFDKVLGLELGADDYVTKPFSVRELQARVKALLRRSAKIDYSSEDMLTVGHLKMNLSSREVFYQERCIDMTLKEFELLKMFMQNRGKVLSRESLLEKIWGFEYFGETRTVDVHVRYLRQKIEVDDSNPVFIETVRGVGYRFSDKM